MFAQMSYLVYLGIKGLYQCDLYQSYYVPEFLWDCKFKRPDYRIASAM